SNSAVESECNSSGNIRPDEVALDEIARRGIAIGIDPDAVAVTVSRNHVSGCRCVATDEVIVGSNLHTDVTTNQSYGARRVCAYQVALDRVVRATPDKNTSAVARDHVARLRGGSTDEIVRRISPGFDQHALVVTVSDEAARIGTEETTLDDVAGAIYDLDAGIESPINRQPSYRASGSASRNYQSIAVAIYEWAADLDQDQGVVTGGQRVLARARLRVAVNRHGAGDLRQL